MRWLPVLSVSTGRYFLPRTRAASDHLIQILLAEPSKPIPCSLRQSVRSVLATDPPLLIHCVMSLRMGNAGGTGHDGSSRLHDRIPVDALVDDLIKNAHHRFTDDSAVLGAPAATPSIQQRFGQLRRYFQTLPPERWIRESAVWLDTTGPPVSPNLISKLPTIDFAALRDQESSAVDPTTDQQGSQSPDSFELPSWSAKIGSCPNGSTNS